jgi:hypothetical protein
MSRHPEGLPSARCRSDPGPPSIHDTHPGSPYSSSAVRARSPSSKPRAKSRPHGPADVDDSSAVLHHRKPGPGLLARTDEVTERVPYRLEAGIDMTAHWHIRR